jgi:L-rhamnose mutarotase
VGYLETEDFFRAQSEMSKREVNTRWQREMSEFLLSPSITRLEEVFHL